MSAELLRTDRLRVGYGAKTVVEDVSLLACPGQILTLIGPNGAGKSTILKTLMRQLSPLGGAIFLSGKTLETFPQAQLAKVSAAVFTGRPRPELMRCVDVVSAGRYPYTGRLGILSERDHEVIRETMRLVGIADIAAE
ncbi:MAG: ABC transporter ATP-binding protein, partial [Clostridia bacterium]|nr:ABC transporter ATP-binding protein [Clostridia bacterium]